MQYCRVPVGWRATFGNGAVTDLESDGAFDDVLDIVLKLPIEESQEESPDVGRLLVEALRYSQL